MAAHEVTFQTRWTEIKNIWKENTWLYAVGGFLVGVMFFPFLQLAVTNIADLLGNLVPEGIGILFTVLFIDVLYRRREEKSRIKDLQEQLIRDASSTSNETAKNAVHQIRKYNNGEWLTGDDGLLKGANLRKARLEWADLGFANLKRTSLFVTHLEGANLGCAHLEEADLGGAHLEGADLAAAHLEGASLVAAHLEGASLIAAHLEGASLIGTHLKGANLGCAYLIGANLEAAHLEEADLGDAHLEGANLFAANLKGVNFWRSTFDENTTLPDGSKWTPDTNVRRFTISQHPE